MSTQIETIFNQDDFIQDLLERDLLSYDLETIQRVLDKKTVLVTGAGGSIGSQLCRQISIIKSINRLIIIDNNEYNLYSINSELCQQFRSDQIEMVLLDITDRLGVRNILNKHQPHFIFHAAAYKHVLMLETQVRIAIKNNIIGTYVMADEAIKAHIETFIFISTDKAVNPISVMGATKRAAEKICHGLNFKNNKTKFSTVRFGNVVNSSGSVVPLFKKMIEKGGPVTITHPDMARFFITLGEASQLILQAATLCEGGELFIFNMGPAIKIRMLAEHMIKLAKKYSSQKINIIYTGVKEGEKMIEEYVYPDEYLESTIYKKIMKAKQKNINFDKVKYILYEIIKLNDKDINTDNEMKKLLFKLVPEYSSINHIKECLSVL